MSGEREPLSGDANARVARQSFTSIELQARAVLREKGMSEEQIDAQLSLSKRESWDLGGLPDSSDHGKGDE